MGTIPMCNTVTNAVTNGVQNAFRTTSRPDQTRPEVFCLGSSICIGHLHLQRHLGNVVTSRTAEAGAL